MVQISVVVPTYNRIHRLPHVLKQLEAQSVPLTSFEVAVVSDGSTDDTAEFMAEYEQVTPLNLRFLQQPNQGVAATRNNGVAHTDGPYILFLDDDVVPGVDLIEKHLQTHQASSEELVVVGPMLNPDNFELQPWVAWEQAMLYKQYDAMLNKEWDPTPRQFYTGNTSLSRDLFEKSGGFDATFKRAEDIELAYRLDDLGATFHFNYDAAGYHYAERSFNSWLNIPYSYGRNDVIFCYEKNQPWIIPTIGREFKKRHPFIRGLTYLCLDNKFFQRSVVTLCKAAGNVLYRLGQKKLSRGALSVIFNLRHYQGMADQLGGRDQFYTEIKTEAPPAQWAEASKV